MSSGFDRTFLIVLVILAVSCSASKQNGFSYHPAHAGPDISGFSESPVVADAPTSTPLSSMPASQSNLAYETPEPQALAADLARLVEQQQAISGSNVERVDARKAVNEIAQAYTSEKNIELTQKQWHKLNRYAAKLEKKQQKRAEVEWGPKNNLEIFLLAAALVGLVVGFFSSFGWFVFLVAALVYLYFKLLKN